MALTAVTPVTWDGRSGDKLLPAVGSFCPLVPFSATPANDTSMTLTFGSLRNIRGWVLQISNSDGALGPIVTAAGNVLTIADGTDLDISAHTSGAIYGFVWGEPKL